MGKKVNMIKIDGINMRILGTFKQSTIVFLCPFTTSGSTLMTLQSALSETYLLGIFVNLWC